MKVKRKADECNRGTEKNSMNSTMDGAFYSQDIDKYFWYDTCYEYNNTNQCTTRYLDLIVRKTLYLDTDDGELDLQGLPWHLIAADLKNHFNLEFTDERLKFAWKGPECGFDGQIITSGEERRGLNITFLFIILMLTRMF
ncbi:uncharacterized protein LOC123543156 [Mercenaria mercenaria]|uniref:uncharacterized protein LOC123543156 n=1 Tax=Mercenaria mercenaria TaxID=6596 RepID=UPI00234ECA65|nr:uncharacterized protein LOC123543156 [Mercenaria mercenaria]